MNLLEAGNVDVEDEVVIVGASCPALDMIACHLPACKKKATRFRSHADNVNRGKKIGYTLVFGMLECKKKK